MNKTIGNILASKRRELGMSQLDIANELARYDIHIKNAAISAWENDKNTPSATQLFALCEILDITDIYTEFIGEHRNYPFAGLNEAGIEKAKEYIALLRGSDLYKNATQAS